MSEHKSIRQIKDPPMRADKKCALPGCDEPLGEITIKHKDPFHSSACCRAWYRLDDTPELVEVRLDS